MVLTALRALSGIADATILAPTGWNDISTISDVLFKPQHLASLNRILSSNSTSMVVQEQKSLVALLISRLCKGSQHQNLLATQGTLDALATILASFVVARGEVIPGAENVAQCDGLYDAFPDPAPLGANLALVLEAISTIIADSRFRTCMLMYSPAIMAVFPSVDSTHPPREAKAAWSALEVSNLGGLRTRTPGAMDYLLPVVPITQQRPLSGQLAQFPPLGYSPSSDNLTAGARPLATKFSGWDPSRAETGSPGADAEAEDAESPLVPWLIHLVRSTDGLERVMAASVLTSLYKAGFAIPERESALGLLVVPLLCRLIRERDKPIPAASQKTNYVDVETALDWAILERAPEVLARLVADSDFLQQAAADCDALKMVGKLLKNAYEPLPGHTAPRPWSPTPDRVASPEEGLPTCRMGPHGHLPIYAHRIRMRESALKMIAGLAARKEEYRKALADQDNLQCIVESLTSTPMKPMSPMEKQRQGKSIQSHQGGEDSPYGINPDSVVIAACHATRVLSRSVSNLRTVLEDSDIALPIYKLLRHPVADIQIAACGVICNLVMDCSPLRGVS